MFEAEKLKEDGKDVARARSPPAKRIKTETLRAIKEPSSESEHPSNPSTPRAPAGDKELIARDDIPEECDWDGPDQGEDGDETFLADDKERHEVRKAGKRPEFRIYPSAYPESPKSFQTPTCRTQKRIYTP